MNCVPVQRRLCSSWAQQTTAEQMCVSDGPTNNVRGPAPICLWDRWRALFCLVAVVRDYRVRHSISLMDSLSRVFLMFLFLPLTFVFIEIIRLCSRYSRVSRPMSFHSDQLCEVDIGAWPSAAAAAAAVPDRTANTVRWCPCWTRKRLALAPMFRLLTEGACVRFQLCSEYQDYFLAPLTARFVDGVCLSFSFCFWFFSFSNRNYWANICTYLIWCGAQSVNRVAFGRWLRLSRMEQRFFASVAFWIVWWTRACALNHLHFLHWKRFCFSSDCEFVHYLVKKICLLGEQLMIISIIAIDTHTRKLIE